MPLVMHLLIKKPITLLLLLLTTVTIVVLTVVIAGKSYVKIDPIPFEDLRHLANRIERHPISTQILSVILIPIVGNVLLFMPWGFFAFISLYSLDRPTVQTYVLTILLGLTFSAAIEGWQYFLPSRVADVNDIIWNTVGTILGAVLGHARLRVRFEFD
jgi:glycopeptide antibiotics resistance protein